MEEPAEHFDFLRGHHNRVQIHRNAALGKCRTGRLSFGENRMENYLGSWSFVGEAKPSWELSRAEKWGKGRDPEKSKRK